MPSYILIRPTVWPQYTNLTDRQDRTGQIDRQRSDSIGRTVLQTVTQKLLTALQCPLLLTFIFIGSRPSDHYFRSVCLPVRLFVCAEFFSAVFDPIWIKLQHMLHVRV